MVTERKVKMTLPDGKIVDGVEVDVDESNERWSEIKLRDGTVLRVKMTVVSAHRADSEYDPTGQPVYALNMAPTMAIVEVPEHLRKKSH